MASEKKRLQRAVGERIRKAREERLITQSQLAKAIGCHQADVSSLESAGRGCSLLRLKKVAKALDLPVAYFLEAN
jgi:transcriptional regulator with XRE-family HTH domain